MSSEYDVDYLIVGGGLSGLSMAMHLQAQGLLKNKTALILESRKEYKHDRSWCGWGVRPHLFEDCISSQWSQWTISRKRQSVMRQSEQYPYQYIRSGDFYNHCLESIENNNQLSIQLRVNVDKIEPHRVLSDQGNFSAEVIFDARAADRSNLSLTDNDNFLLQCFHGWQVRTEQPVFDPTTVTLMDFPDRQKLGINFLYVLPFNQHEALIEPTYFLHHTNIPKQQHFQDLMTQHLTETLNCHQWQVREHESGVLPMMRMPVKQNTHSVIPIGTHAGLLRPSTGYAFYGIQRYCQQICQSLKNNVAHIDPPPYKKTSLWMDDVFLKVCRQAPAQAADIYYALFKHCNADQIARFMQDEAKWTDLLGVITSVPSKPFIRAAVLTS